MLLLDDEGPLYQPQRRMDLIRTDSTKMNILLIHNLILYLTYLSNHFAVGLVITNYHRSSRFLTLPIKSKAALFISQFYSPQSRGPSYYSDQDSPTHPFSCFFIPRVNFITINQGFDEHAKEVTIHQQLFTPGSTKFHLRRLADSQANYSFDTWPLRHNIW